MPTATLTSKGQVTIPKSIRDRMDLHVGDQLDFSLDDRGRVVIEPITGDYRLLEAIFYEPGRKAATVEEMDEAVGELLGRTLDHDEDHW